jgi:two-component system response regulator MprA
MIEDTIALLEDDRALRESLRKGLRAEGYTVWAAATGTEFLDLLDQRTPHLLILDIGLPDADGRDVCRAARARGVDAPALFLSARSGVPDRLSAFAAGGDDYLVKPFSFAELLARAQAMIRRHRRTVSSSPRIPLDPATLTWSSAHGEIPLTPTEFRLLAALAGAGGDIVRRSDLVRAAWPGDDPVSDNALDAFVARLRRKLRTAEDSESPTIVTVHGVGYRLQ